MLVYLLLAVVFLALGLAWTREAGRPGRSRADAGGGDGSAGGGWIDSTGDCGDAGGDGGGDGGGGCD
jgi:hypothetical protein